MRTSCTTPTTDSAIGRTHSLIKALVRAGDCLAGLRSKAWGAPRVSADPAFEQAALQRGATLADLSSRLDALHGRLGDLPHDLEVEVNGISDGLERLPKTARTLLTASEAFLEAASGRECGDSLFSPILSFIDPPLVFLRESGARVSSLTSTLEEIAQQIEDLLREEEATYNMMSQLRYVRPMIRIEASRFEGDVESTILGLGERIELFTNKLGEALCGKFGVLRDAQGIIGDAVRRLRTSAEQIAGSTRSSDRRIHSLIGEFREGLLVNATRDIRLTSVATEFTQLVGKMVVSLQSQDIVTQRLAHLREAIEQLQHRLTSSEGGDTLVIARVAAAQLTSVEEQVAQTERDLRAAVRSAGELLQKLETSCLTLPEFKVKTVGDDGLCRVLIDTIGGFHQLVTHVVDEVGELSQLVAPLGGHASRGTTLMRGISVEIRVIALNSEINSSNVPGGHALEVLASHVSQVSMEATANAQRSARQSDELVQRLDEVVADFESFRAAAAEIGSQLSAGRDEQERPLHALAAEADHAREEVVAAIALATALLRQIEPHLDLTAIVTRAVEPASALLAEIAAFFADEALSLPASNDAAQWTATYTMEEERRHPPRRAPPVTGPRPVCLSRSEPDDAGRRDTRQAAVATAAIASPAVTSAAGEIEFF